MSKNLRWNSKELIGISPQKPIDISKLNKFSRNNSQESINTQISIGQSNLIPALKLKKKMHQQSNKLHSNSNIKTLLTYKKRDQKPASTQLQRKSNNEKSKLIKVIIQLKNFVKVLKNSIKLLKDQFLNSFKNVSLQLAEKIQQISNLTTKNIDYSFVDNFNQNIKQTFDNHHKYLSFQDKLMENSIIFVQSLNQSIDKSEQIGIESIIRKNIGDKNIKKTNDTVYCSKILHKKKLNQQNQAEETSIIRKYQNSKPLKKNQICSIQNIRKLQQKLSHYKQLETQKDQTFLHEESMNKITAYLKQEKRLFRQ